MTVKYEGSLRCMVTHEPSGGSFQTDAPVDNNGKGEAASPTDLCAAALGSCMATIIGMQIEKSSYKPRRIIRLSTEVWLPVKLATEQKRLVELAAKGCPVHHSLSSEIDKPIHFHWQ